MIGCFKKEQRKLTELMLLNKGKRNPDYTLTRVRANRLSNNWALFNMLTYMYLFTSMRFVGEDRF